MRAKGNGFAVVQLSCNYFLNKTLPAPKFNVLVEFDGGSCDSKLIMKVCASFITRFAFDKTNMVVVKIELPSGFIYDTDSDVALSPEIMVKSNKFHDLNCQNNLIFIESGTTLRRYIFGRIS